MEARDRILRSVRGEATDRPAAAPYMGNFAIRAAGMKLSECYLNAGKMAEAQLRTWDMLKQDVIVVQSDNYYMAEAFGAPVRHSGDTLPVLQERIIRKPQDVYALKRVDPGSGGRMPVYIEAVSRVSREVGRAAAVRGCGTGPFVLAGHLCGIEQLLLWMAETEMGERDCTRELDHLFSLGLETLLAFASAQLEAGAAIIQLADSLASLNVISPAMYRKYVFPYEKEFFTRIRSLCRKHDAVALLHICGDNRAVLADYVRTGADIIAIDHAVDLPEARRIVGEDTCIIGNLDPSGALLFGDPEAVRQEANEALAVGLSGRYILGTGCEVAPDTPVVNIRAMLQAAAEYPRQLRGDGR